MTFLQAIVLGLIQGLTEFLPVSSSGHLVLAEHFFKWAPSADITFEVLLHLGSLLAVLIYFRRDIFNLLSSLFHWSPTNTKHTSNHWVLLYLLVATAITGAVGFLFQDFFENQFSKPQLVATMLLITGVILVISDFIRNSTWRMENMGIFRALLIGIGQTIAIMPGISRSGTTIAVSLYAGVRREDAARFSFLLSIPAILGANIGEISNILHLDRSLFGFYLAGMLAAFISGYLVIALLLGIIRRRKLRYFAYYVWVIGIVSLILLNRGM